MRDKPIDGGPAFPVPGFPSEWNEPIHGLTKREWFAGKAIQGILMDADFTDRTASQDWADAAVNVADAMIARLKEPND